MSALTQQLFRIWKHGFDAESNTDRDHCEEIGKVCTIIEDLVEACKHSLQTLKKMECECDSYEGFVCGKHKWEDMLEAAIAKAEKGE